MYKKVKKPKKTSLRINQSTEGEMLEQKIERIMTQNEPITDGAPVMYTERKDGVRPEFDIKTDRFDIAIDAMTAIAKSATAKRQASIDERTKAAEKPAGEVTGGQTTDGTN